LVKLYDELKFKGFYLKRQISMGRGVIIPHFGTFTFTAPEVTLKGVTNEEERDK
jgi:hypothetical protein